MQAKVNDEMGIWKVHHLTIPDENNSKCAGTETVHNGMKGHFNKVVLVPTTPHEEKPVAKWNHLTEQKANKFAQMCKIWDVSEITKVDGMSS